MPCLVNICGSPAFFTTESERGVGLGKGEDKGRNWDEWKGRKLSGMKCVREEKVNKF